MKSASIRAVVVLGVLAIAGIVGLQVYWVHQAFDAEARQFNQSVHLALRRVAASLARANGHSLPASPVHQLSASYFVVNVNDQIDATLLDAYLRREFSDPGLRCDYEYAIYDCDTDRMVAGNYVRASSLAGAASPFSARGRALPGAPARTPAPSAPWQLAHFS